MKSRFVRWLRRMAGLEVTPRRPSRFARLMLETLESRTVPTATWIGGATGSWNSAANWSGATGGGLPGATDDVVIANANVSHSAFVTDQIKSLTLTNATFNL